VRTALLALLLLAVCAPARAGFGTSDIGTSGAQFLKLGAGARAEGMGEAYTAVVDGPDAMYWNPAALTRLSAAHEATVMDSSLPAQINYGFLAYAQPLTQYGGIGTSLQYVTQPGIAETDSSGFNTGSTFHPSDLAASVGGAYKIHYEDGGVFNGASVGVTGKYIQSTITKTASTFGADIGFLSAPFKVLDRDFRFSYVAQNLGGQLRFQQLSDPLPTNLRLGSAWNLTRDWVFAADFNEPLDNAPYFAVGTEYTAHFDQASFSGRLGLNTRALGATGGLNGMSMGIGAKFRRIGMDYSFLTMGGLGVNHYVSVNFSF